MQYYVLARVMADHPGWEAEKRQVEAGISHAVSQAGESYRDVVLDAWSRTYAGARFFQYETCSLRVLELFLEQCAEETESTWALACA